MTITRPEEAEPVGDMLPALMERLRKRSAAILDEQERIASYLENNPVEFNRLYVEALAENRRRNVELVRVQVPPKFRKDLPLSMFPREIKTWVDDFMEGKDALGPKYSLCLVGRPGAGKSHALWEIVKEVAARKGFSRFIKDEYLVRDATDLLDDLRPSSGIPEHQTIAQCADVDLLVLDDLGANKLTDWREEKILQIIRKRDERMAPTIITTNFPGSQFSERFGSRTASRLGGMCRLVVFPDIDYRTNTDYRGDGKPKKLQLDEAGFPEPLVDGGRR